ncbi:MAG: glycosyltransferase family 2 protein [Candidatus Margulisbacteria bacterium]|nr:glycosyltransferase family 2 protein [Candidatus Margulisiibacteriota bacterium]
MERKPLSICTLTWDQLALTEKFVASVRRNTTVPYELIIVDNGSTDGTADFIKRQADKYHLFPQNTGFAHGFNQAFSLAEGEFVLAINNDTELPKNWFEKLRDTFDRDPRCGLVYPCYTFGQKVGLRWWPGTKVKQLPRFSKELPAAVAILSKLPIIYGELKGFSEEYQIAGGEDLDLCFKTWSAGYNIYLDERVLVKHKGHGTAAKKLPNWKELYTKNGDFFQAKWQSYFKKS